MNPTESQPQESQLSPEDELKDFGDSKASLAFSNMLREQMFTMENPPMEEGTKETPEEGPISPEMAPQEEEELVLDEETIEEPKDNTEDIRKEMDELKKELHNTIKDEISGIKDLIKDALKED